MNLMQVFRNGLATATSRVLIPALIALSPIGVNAAGTQGTVKVVTEPAGAEVFVDGQPKGVSPLTIDGLSAGEHRVRVVKDGFVEHSNVVKVMPGVEVTASVEMTRASAEASPAATTAVAESPSEGWSTSKKALVGGGALAVVGGAVALLAGGSGSDADAANAAPAAGTIGVTPAGQTIAGITNLSFTADGASDPEGQPLTYSWNFGDGASGSGQTATHVYNIGGTFPVSVAVSDGSQSTNATRSVQVSDIQATWLSRFWEPWFPEGVSRRVSFSQSGSQFSGIYRCNLAPGRTGTASGTLSAPRTIAFEAHLIDANGQDVGFTFTGTLNDDLTTFNGVANGYKLNNRKIDFGRTGE